MNWMVPRNHASLSSAVSSPSRHKATREFSRSAFGMGVVFLAGAMVTATAFEAHAERKTTPDTEADSPQYVQVAQTQTGAERERPDVAALSEKGGVLTPRGTLVFEPSIEYAHTSVDRFVFQGVEIVDTVLIGVIDASRADRDVITPALGFRYGVTNRFEISAKVPWVYRHDRSLDTIPDGGGGTIEQERSISGSSIGDVEMGLHFQLNDGPVYLVSNLRVKSDTGDGPFDVNRDLLTGVETEAATGSGFWGVEPSLTALFPTDPAVFYGNIGYLWNMSQDVDTVLRPASTSPVLVGKVHPGDAVRVSFGMGYAMNERASFSIGYQHDFLNATTTVVDGSGQKGERLDVGAMSFGVSYQVSDRTSLNLSVLPGVTDDAPDVRVIFRIPIATSLF